MKLHEGTAGLDQFKMTIQTLFFVMLRLYNLVGQTGHSASQSVMGSGVHSGCTVFGQTDPACPRAYFISHSGLTVYTPLLPNAE